ncbi:MAG: metallophosphoesterase family protein [Bacteroidia bacterium]|nr:metallophosphoesterase family protein [Bacteroidia bacterium]
MRKIAISDIHGCIKTLRALVEQQLRLTRQDELFLLGDFIDRGPDSKGVLDYLMQLEESGYQVRMLKGNHEVMMVESVRDSASVTNWIYNGGQEALQSFGVSDPAEIPQRYIDFVDRLHLYLEVDRYILVHAGLNFVPNAKTQSKGKDSGNFLFRVHNPLLDYESMLWIRFWYDDIDWRWLRDRIIVHGHTPMETDDIVDMLRVLDEDQVIDIDNGCFAKYKPGLGRLCALDLTSRQLYFQDNIE